MNNYIANNLRYLVGIGKTGRPIPDSRKVVFRGVNGISLTIVAAMLLLAPLFSVVTGNWTLMLESVIIAGLFMSVLILNIRGKYDIANLGFYLVLNALTFYLGQLSRNLSVQMWIYFLLFALIFLIFQEKKARLFALIVIIGRILFFQANLNYLLLASYIGAEKSNDPIEWISVALLISLALLTFYLYSSKQALTEKISLKRKEFGQDLSHDVHGALFSLIGISGDLKEAYEEKRTLKNEGELIESLDGSLNLFAKVVENFLNHAKADLASSEAVHLEELDLGAEIEEIARLHRYRTRPKGIELKVSISNDLPGIIITDKTRIIRIVVNLLTNAIKNTARGHSILVELTAVEGEWKLAVSNEGKGLQKDEISSLFIRTHWEDEFEASYNQGLGLPIVKDSVEALGGHLEVLSDMMKNSFIVSVPIGQ